MLKAIAFGELSQKNVDETLKHHRLILDSIAYAKANARDFAEVNIVELAVEVATVKLAHLVAPYITGYMHIQANPSYCYDKTLLIKNAQSEFLVLSAYDATPTGVFSDASSAGLVALSKRLDSSHGSHNTCIKILATWDGLQACAELEKQGVRCLATGIVSLHQATLASAVGCAYSACYVNELRVHFDKSSVPRHLLFFLILGSLMF